MIMRIPALYALIRKAEWEESKHPRADDGRFGSGSGGSHPSKKPSKTKRKMERRAEAAGQGKLGGGAIQSLLGGGGSALDKIGWLNTSKPKEPDKKPDEGPGESEPSILDTMAQSWARSDAARGKVPGLEHPSHQAAREGGREGGPSPRVLTPGERQYRENQGQWDADRRRMGIPVPGDELAELTIPGKKPETQGKPKPAKVESAKREISENIKSGKLKKETVIAAVKTLHERANEAESRGDDKTAREMDLRAEIMTDAAGIKGELYTRGITQIRGRSSHIGPGIESRTIPPEGIWTGTGPRPPTDPKRDEEIRRLGRAPKPINSRETAHRIENYQNKVISYGEQVDQLKDGDQDIGLYEYNGKTYLVDHDRPSQFSVMSKDDWRRLKDELTGDEGTRPTTQPKAKPDPSPATNNPHITEVSGTDILAQGKKIDEHGKASLHEYNGGFYMVTQGKPMGRKISKPAWESLKYS